MLPPGFEPGFRPREGRVLDRTRLREHNVIKIGYFINLTSILYHTSYVYHNFMM